MTKPRAAKRPSGALKTNHEASLRGFVAIHSTDATVFLSAGFLSSCASGSAEQATHLAPLIVSTSPVPASLLNRACGTRDFGFAVILEIEIPIDGAEQIGQGAFVAKAPVPIANVLSINFKTDDQQKEFHARAGSYGDVPLAACIFKVDPSLFGEPDSGDLFALPDLRGSDAFPQMLIADKIGGAVSTYLAAARSVSESGAVGWLQEAFKNPAPSPMTLPNVLGGLAAAMGGSDSADVRLIEDAGTILGAMEPGSGFRRQELLSGLAKRAGASGDEKFSAFANRFVKHAEDIAAARRDLADDAFSETDGKIQLRALLLFVLNPDPERLLLAAGRIKVLGPRVFCLAAAVAGGFGGLSRLPSSIKAPSRQAYSGLTLLVHQAISGQRSPIERMLAWNDKGARQDILAVAGNEVARSETAAPKVLSTAFGIAFHGGLKPKFSGETGELEVTSDKYNVLISLRVSKVPTVPPIDGLRAGSQLLLTAGVKRLRECADIINETAQETGIFARVVALGPRRGVEVFATSPQDRLTDATLGALVAAVGETISTLRDKLQGRETATAGAAMAANNPSGSPESGPTV